jgi:hypothetical protein
LKNSKNLPQNEIKPNNSDEAEKVLSINDTNNLNNADQPYQNGLQRRQLLRFAGVSAAFAAAAEFLTPNKAEAATWQKLGVATVIASKARLPFRNGKIRNTIASGSSLCIALRSDGLVFACGYNNEGQLGDNTTTSKRTYVQATGISNAVAVANGSSRMTYVQATGISNAVAVAGNNQSIALRSDGLVFGCGSNNNGQLGNGTTGNIWTYIRATGI